MELSGQVMMGMFYDNASIKARLAYKRNRISVSPLFTAELTMLGARRRGDNAILYEQSVFKGRFGFCRPNLRFQARIRKISTLMYLNMASLACYK